MPYIKDATKRKRIRELMDMALVYIDEKGDLNFAICTLVALLILRNGIGYTKMSEMIDAVHDAECELRRRLLDPYEEIKMVENSDVRDFETILDKMKE